MRQLIAGNWKMNGLGDGLAELERLKAVASSARAEIMVCPPATLIARAAQAVAGAFAIGAQDCSSESRGAFTGDISADMLRDAGATAVILGHSERRNGHGESDAVVNAKAHAAWRAGLKAIICVGESASQRKDGAANSCCKGQISSSVPDGANAANCVLAYEPIWAIGTGVTPTLDQIRDMHAFLRQELVGALGEGGRDIAILYGGSVNGGNAKDILALAEVGGALVGGASLKAADFWPIIAAAKA